MINNLKQENFQPYGMVSPRDSRQIQSRNSYSIALSPGESRNYETLDSTWIAGEVGRTILSISTGDGKYEDYYLDRIVELHAHVKFQLTSFEKQSEVRAAAVTMPRYLGSCPAENRFVIRPSLQVLGIYSVFYQEPEPGFLLPGSSHSMLELTYVDRGRLHSVVDGQDILLSQGDVTLYGPDQWHMQYGDVGQAPRYVTVTFQARGSGLQALVGRRIPAGTRGGSLIRQMLWEQEHGDSHTGDMLLSLMSQLLLCLLRSDGGDPEKLPTRHSLSSENRIIGRAMEFVQTHVREKLSVPIVARGVEISPSYLTALFQKHLHISPGEYVRRMKLQESKQLIRQGEMNFTEIAHCLQYSTIHQFSRQFKDKFGITPSEYARSVRG